MSSRGVFVAVLLHGVLAGGPEVDAQPAKIPTIGYLSMATPTSNAPFLEAFKQGLRELGYVEGKTVAVTVRYGEPDPNDFPS